MKDKTPQHTLKVGLVLCSTWGYEQTNADFYKVIATPTAHNIVVQKLETVCTESSPLAMCGTAVPGNPTGELFTKRVVKKWHDPRNGDEDCIRITSYSSAELWDGRPVQVSWYG